MQVLALDSRIWFTGAPSAGGGLVRVSPCGGIPPLPPKLTCPPPPCPPPTVLTQKFQCCNFHAVFGCFVQIVPPPVDSIWESLKKSKFCEYLHSERLISDYFA